MAPLWLLMCTLSWDPTWWAKPPLWHIHALQDQSRDLAIPYVGLSWTVARRPIYRDPTPCLEGGLSRQRSQRALLWMSIRSISSSQKEWSNPPDQVCYYYSTKVEKQALLSIGTNPVDCASSHQHSIMPLPCHLSIRWDCTEQSVKIAHHHHHCLAVLCSLLHILCIC